jgi:hypothetical protein
MLRRALPTSLIAGAVVLTTPAHGMAAIREVVLSKAAVVTAAGKAAKSSLLFGLGKKGGRVVSVGTFAAVTLGIAVLDSGDEEVGHVVRGDHAPGIATLDMARSGSQDMSPINADSNNLSNFHSPSPQVAIPFQPSDSMRILPMTPKTLASFSTPQPSAVPVPVQVRTLSTLVLSTTLLFPVLLPSQSTIYSYKGENAAEKLGISVSPASDVNLDGYPDLLAGAYGWADTNLGGFSHGRLYLYSGKDGTLLLTYQGEQASTDLGSSVSHANDVNLDGYPDMVTGAQSWDPNTSFRLKGSIVRKCVM